jgi:hypothetical protein
MTHEHLPTVLVMAIVLLVIVGFIARADITVRAPATTGEIDISAHNEHQFKQGFGFSVRSDLRQLEGSKLLDEIGRLGLRTRSGERLHGFVVDRQHGLIVGTSAARTQLEISLIKKGANGSELLVSGRDEQGNFTTLRAEQVGVFDFKGSHLGFELQRFADVKEQRAYFLVLLDRSGSMSTVMQAVKQAASSFMGSLPSNAYCRVLSFSDRLTQHTPGFVPCANASKELGSIKAGGGTNLYGALVSAYAELSSITDSLKAVLLITDGVGDGGMRKDHVLKRKNAPTHVYFLGSHRAEQLTGIADGFILGDHDVKQVLQRYFSQLSASVHNQFVIRTPEK